MFLMRIERLTGGHTAQAAFFHQGMQKMSFWFVERHQLHTAGVTKLVHFSIFLLVVRSNLLIAAVCCTSE